MRGVCELVPVSRWRYLLWFWCSGLAWRAAGVLRCAAAQSGAACSPECCCVLSWNAASLIYYTQTLQHPRRAGVQRAAWDALGHEMSSETAGGCLIRVGPSRTEPPITENNRKYSLWACHTSALCSDLHFYFYFYFFRELKGSIIPPVSCCHGYRSGCFIVVYIYHWGELEDIHGDMQVIIILTANYNYISVVHTFSAVTSSFTIKHHISKCLITINIISQYINICSQLIDS